MTLLIADTTITYPDGPATSTGTVIHVELLSDMAVRDLARHDRVPPGRYRLA